MARAALHYALERRGARVVGLDPGEEDESLPWFAPVRALARQNGVPLGRNPADLVLDCDPDARPVRPEGVGLRVLAPPGARSPDLNRALLGPGPWDMVVTDGVGAWARRAVEPPTDADAEDLVNLGTLRALEALDAAWDSVVEGSSPAEPLPRPLLGGRWRAQEGIVVWEQPGDRLVARIRACAGPYGGARAYLGDTVVHLLDARLARDTTPPEWAPGTIVSMDGSLVVATGRGLIEITKVKPGWRPPRNAVGLALECGLSPGYLLA
jgi:hypothetical protein